MYVDKRIILYTFFFITPSRTRDLLLSILRPSIEEFNEPFEF